jgi:hypothetical protein
MADVRVLSDLVNNVVVQVEERRYPGMVVQGDRLKNWASLADRADVESIEILAQELRDMIVEYDRAASEHGLGMGF